MRSVYTLQAGGRVERALPRWTEFRPPLETKCSTVRQVRPVPAACHARKWGIEMPRSALSEGSEGRDGARGPGSIYSGLSGFVRATHRHRSHGRSQVRLSAPADWKRVHSRARSTRMARAAFLELPRLRLDLLQRAGAWGVHGNLACGGHPRRLHPTPLHLQHA